MTAAKFHETLPIYELQLRTHMLRAVRTHNNNYREEYFREWEGGANHEIHENNLELYGTSGTVSTEGQ